MALWILPRLEAVFSKMFALSPGSLAWWQRGWISSKEKLERKLPPFRNAKLLRKDRARLFFVKPKPLPF